MSEHIRGPRDAMCWRKATVERVVREWQMLSDWVPWLVDRYMLDHRTIPPCWFQHGPLIDLLTALHDKWRYCHDPAADASLPIEWQRSLREFEPRLRDFTSRTGCSRDQHRETAPMLRADDKQAMHKYIDVDIAARRERATKPSGWLEGRETSAHTDANVAPGATPEG